MKLAETLSQNGRLADLVEEIEITTSWFPSDGIERAREAYGRILRSCSRVKGIAFMETKVSGGNYAGVLSGALLEPRPRLRSLTIGLENYDMLDTLPLLKKGHSGHSQLAPNLIHVQLHIPHHVNFPRLHDLAALPSTIRYLDISCWWRTWQSFWLPDIGISQLLQRSGLKVLTIILPHNALHDEDDDALAKLLESDALTSFTYLPPSSPLSDPETPGPAFRIVRAAEPSEEWDTANMDSRDTSHMAVVAVEDFGLGYQLRAANVGDSYDRDLMLVWWKALADEKRRAIIREEESSGPS